MLINDILDIAKLDRTNGGGYSGTLSIFQTDFYLDSCLKETIEMLRFQANEKKLDLRLEIQLSPEECQVRSDATRLRQVLVNLIGNAIKYTDSGFIDVRVTREPSLGHFVIQVTDTGRGIPRNYQSKLFTPFSQAERPDTRVYGGTGLGTFLALIDG